jgi:hypothetical protein
MATYITIPEPCHEDWNSMSVEDQGRHCLKCAKTVIDFTGWETTDITAYLRVNTQTKVCGRFAAGQLSSPIEETPQLYLKQICFANVSIFKKIAAIFLIAFGFSAASCNEDVKGKTASLTVDTTSFATTGEVIKEEKPDTVPVWPPIPEANIIHTEITPPVIDVVIFEPPAPTGTPALIEVDTVLTDIKKEVE